jgi:hypothetical protein
MKRRTVLVVAGLMLAAFVVGGAVGAWLFPRPVVYREIPGPSPAAADPMAEGTTLTRPAESASGPVTTASSGSGSAACVDIRNAATLEGKRGCVGGLILRVYTARSGNSFLDFCQDYRTCPFTSVIFSKDQAKFGDLGSLQGKRVEIKGDVVAYQGRAEIILHDPQQVRSGP